MIRKNELGCFTSLLIIISSLFFSASIAQSFLPNFRHYSVADGLPSTEVYQITSDAKNNLWFATDRGVVRYDGYAFRVFNTKDSLPDNSVIKVYKDSKQRIWFISFTSHLSYYENGRIVLYKYNKQLTEHIGRGLIASLYVDKNDNIKVNSVDIGTFSIDNKGRLQQLDLISDTCEFVISETEPGIANTKIHCNNNYSATRFNVSIPTSRFSFTIPVGIRSQHFNTIILKNGDFIFYADRYMIRIHRNGTYEIKILANKILNVFEDHDENIWVGCLHDGVYIYDSYMHSSSHFLSESSISHIYADYEGGFWLSSLENGIFYLPSKNINSLNVSGNVMHDKITSIVNKADSLLFFSNSKGVLFRYSLPDHDLKSINLKQNREIDMESINALTFKNSTNDLIVSTAAGLKFDSISLHKMNWEGLNLTTLPSFIKFFQSDNDNLLGSDYSYAYSLNLSKSSINYINKTQFRSTVLFQDSQKRLFSGSLNGLYILNDDNFIPFKHDQPVFKNRITDINETSDHYLVIGTRSNGLIIFKDSIIEHITSFNGVNNVNINKLAIENNLIWTATNKGLYKVTITNTNPFTYSIQHFDVYDGLVSNEINDIALGVRSIYAGTSEGISQIDKINTINKPTEIPIYINVIKINDRDTLLSSGYSLNYQQSTINISYSAVTFHNAKNIIYQYRLLGLDTIWRNTMNRDVQFTSLQEGQYRFQLTTLSKDAFSPNKIIEITFHISPPYYKTTWFRALFALTTILMIILIINLRIRGIRKKEKIETELNKKMSELNLKALRSQMNPHFTFNVLNSIQYYVAKKDTEQALLFITKFSRLIRTILDQSRNLYITLEEEINMLKLYLELEKLRFEDKFSYSISVDPGINLQSVTIPGMLIQPYVENAVKHGLQFKKGEAHIEVHFNSIDSRLICKVIDNGIGRSAAAELNPAVDGHKSAGTAIVNDRMEALNILFENNLKSTTIDLTDDNGIPSGTAVTIEIPFKTTPS